MNATSGFDRLVEAFRERGHTPAAARLAALGRGGVEVEGGSSTTFDRLVESYERQGMTPKAARLAAAGRGHTESEARAAAEGEYPPLLRAAELSATRATALTEAYASRGLAVPGHLSPARPIAIREVGSPDQAAALVAEAASARLGMPQAEARQYAVRLLERETARGGQAHALTWMRRLGEALRGQAAA